MRLSVGIGCDRNTPQATLETALLAALGQVGSSPLQVSGLASIAAKADETGLLALAAEHAWPLHFYSAEQLAAVPVPNPSEVVRKYMGTPSVSEAAALLAAGPGAELLLEKHKHRDAQGYHATISLARNPA